MPNLIFDGEDRTITDEAQVAEFAETFREILEETEDFSATIVTPSKNYDGEVESTSETSCDIGTTDGNVSINYNEDKENVTYTAYPE